MYIGYMGDIVFITSVDYLLTPSNYDREASGRWAEHDLLMRKPVSQFGGPGLEKLSFDILLDAGHGISPDRQLEKLRKMRDMGAVFPLVIGGQPVSQSSWRLDSLKESDHFFTSMGQLQQCRVSIQLTEYADTNDTEEGVLNSGASRGGI